MKELHRHDLEVGGRVGLSDESVGLEKMLGHFEEGGESGRDVNENWEDGDLMKEIRWTKENLEQTMQPNDRWKCTINNDYET